jgi:hypothetical protein
MSKKSYEGEGVRGLIPAEENRSGILSPVPVVEFSFLDVDKGRSLAIETLPEYLLGT